MQQNNDDTINVQSQYSNISHVLDSLAHVLDSLELILLEIMSKQTNNF